jgi:hypothetical protein
MPDRRVVVGEQAPREVFLPSPFLATSASSCSPALLSFTFGRGTTRTLRFTHDSACGQPDRDVSRCAGTIWWENGLWWVRNDSTTRPFDIITPQGVRIPLLLRSWPDSQVVWVPPPNLRIKIEGPYGRMCSRWRSAMRISPVPSPKRVTTRAPEAPASDAPGSADPRREVSCAQRSRRGRWRSGGGGLRQRRTGRDGASRDPKSG